MTSILVTGGTGSFGQAFIRHLLSGEWKERIDVTPWNAPKRQYLDGDSLRIDKVVVFSRDELKQHQMREQGLTDPRLRYFIGDVRDRTRLRRALDGIDICVHAAALKQVDSCEYNPAEAVKTNIGGAQNIIEAALDVGCRKVLALGTDKAVDPTNLYGATKLVAEKLFVDANAYSGKDGPVFAATRYGNVLNSRGSVLPKFQAQHAAGQPLTITDHSMTRFVLTLEQGVRFVQDCLDTMVGGEVFVPKLDAVTVKTIANTVSEGIVTSSLGIRPGEKMHELLVSEHEAHRTIDAGWCYIVKPIQDLGRTWEGEPVPAGFRYGSDTAVRLDVERFKEMAGLT